MKTIKALRNLDRGAEDYDLDKKRLKAKLQCYTPSGLLETKAAGKMKEISRTGMLQLDFDHKDIFEYDIEELKKYVFGLSCVGYCGLSCSGDGFYALVRIAEPYRLAEYAEHIFEILEGYGLRVDRSKGKKVENLRYISYDPNELCRENPDALCVKNFRSKLPTAELSAKSMNRNRSLYGGGLVNSSLNKIRSAKKGHRWNTIRQVAFTLGGIGDPGLINAIINEINANPDFRGEENQFIKCAYDCFNAGYAKPLGRGGLKNK